MPHADPTWATHSPLVAFNEGGGAIWTGCHAFSVLENVDSPLDPDVNPNMNFLTSVLGRALLSIPFVVFGLGHFAQAQQMAGMVPAWVPMSST